MQRHEIRLELIKLAFRHDRTPAQTLEVAKALEEYVGESETKQDAPKVQAQPLAGAYQGKGVKKPGTS